MVETAFSKQLNKSISSVDVRHLQTIDALTDQYAFTCTDKSCNVSLTCWAWEPTSRNSKPRFVISDHDQPHIFRCSALSSSEIKNQTKTELSAAKTIHLKDQSFTFGNPSKSIRNTTSDTSSFNPVSNNHEVIKTSSHSKKRKTTQSNFSSLTTFVNIFHDVSLINASFNVDFHFEVRDKYNFNQIKPIGLKGTTHMSNFFRHMSLPIIPSQLFIYYGSVTIVKKEDSPIVYIKFKDKPDNYILTNQSSLEKMREWPDIKTAIVNDYEVNVFFIGMFITSSQNPKKLIPVPLTSSNYRSLLFTTP